MQVRAIAITGVSGIGDPLPAFDSCSLPDLQTVGLQMRINSHGSVIMQYAYLIGTSQVALFLGRAVKIVLHIHDDDRTVQPVWVYRSA